MAEQHAAVVMQLPPEILYSIFGISADIGEKRPLETARHTSQVCSLWRNTILTAPRIWGSIIKLSELQVERNNSPWRDMVIERAQDAPLFIQGNISMNRVEWFLGFLSSHWEKVFYIAVQPGGRLELYDNPQSTKFLNNPPRSIQDFHFPRVRFDLGVPWVADLRAISLWHPFRTSEILQALATMPRLEHAVIHLWVPEHRFEREPSIQSIVLPQLKSLQIYHCLEEVAYLLQFLVPNQQCEYTIHTVDTGFRNHTLEEWDVFSRYLQHCIVHRRETTLELYIQDTCINIEIIGDPTGMPAFFHRHSIDRRVVRYQNNISTSLTRFTSRPSIFERVTGLVFHIIDNDQRDLHQYVDSFKVFFSFFQSVSTLQLSQQSMKFLTEVCEWAEVPFPSLKTLELQVFDNPFDSRLETSLPHFLDQRRLGGKAIDTLHVFPEAAESDVNWSFLEEFNDLTVGWVQEEYLE